MNWKPQPGEYFRSNYGHELREILAVEENPTLKRWEVHHVGVRPVKNGKNVEYRRTNVTLITDYQFFVSHWVTKPIRKNKNGVLDTRA